MFGQPVSLLLTLPVASSYPASLVILCLFLMHSLFSAKRRGPGGTCYPKFSFRHGLFLHLCLDTVTITPGPDQRWEAFMEDILHAYFAGIFDGEGTVTMVRQRSTERKSPVVSVSSTTRCILEELKHHYGGHISTQKVYQDHHKQSWSWKLSFNSALAFLQLIRPFMREPEKVRRTDLLLNNYKKATPRNGKYSPDQLLLREKLEHEFFHPSTP